jgi:hypothetical protein
LPADVGRGDRLVPEPRAAAERPAGGVFAVQGPL